MEKLFLFILLLLSQAVFSSETVQSSDKAKAITMENTLFNHLIGNWDIQDWTLDPKGEWQKGPGADWNWYKILDGQAIQDDWISASLSLSLDPGKRQFGTNIRIYNPKKNQQRN